MNCNSRRITLPKQVKSRLSRKKKREWGCIFPTEPEEETLRSLCQGCPVGQDAALRRSLLPHQHHPQTGLSHSARYGARALRQPEVPRPVHHHLRRDNVPGFCQYLSEPVHLPHHEFTFKRCV